MTISKSSMIALLQAMPKPFPIFHGDIRRAGCDCLLVGAEVSASLATAARNPSQIRGSVKHIRCRSKDVKSIFGLTRFPSSLLESLFIDSKSNPCLPHFFFFCGWGEGFSHFETSYCWGRRTSSHGILLAATFVGSGLRV